VRWLENPYYQHFCGEKSFRHRQPFDRSSLSRWRQRLREAQRAPRGPDPGGPVGGAPDRGAGDEGPGAVAVDTTVQPKAVAFPADVRLMHVGIVWLGRLASGGVPLRQSYVRVAERAALMAGRYTHGKQFKRNRPLWAAHAA